MNDDLTEKLKQLEEIQHAVHSHITSVNSRVNNVELDQRAINDSVRRMQLDFLTINEWLSKLIANRNQQNSST